MEQAVANDAAVALPDAELDAFLRRLLFLKSGFTSSAGGDQSFITIYRKIAKRFFSIISFQSLNATLRVLQWKVKRNPSGPLVSEISGVQSLGGARKRITQFLSRL